MKKALCALFFFSCAMTSPHSALAQVCDTRENLIQSLSEMFGQRIIGRGLSDVDGTLVELLVSSGDDKRWVIIKSYAEKKGTIEETCTVDYGKPWFEPTEELGDTIKTDL